MKRKIYLRQGVRAAQVIVGGAIADPSPTTEPNVTLFGVIRLLSIQAVVPIGHNIISTITTEPFQSLRLGRCFLGVLAFATGKTRASKALTPGTPLPSWIPGPRTQGACYGHISTITAGYPWSPLDQTDTREHRQTAQASEAILKNSVGPVIYLKENKQISYWPFEN